MQLKSTFAEKGSEISGQPIKTALGYMQSLIVYNLEGWNWKDLLIKNYNNGLQRKSKYITFSSRVLSAAILCI